MADRSTKTISIDVGSKYLHIVQGTEKNGIVEIDNCSMVPTPTASVSDGKITGLAQLKTAIYDCINRAKMKAKDVIITTQSTAVITRDVVLPEVDGKTLKEMVKYEMEQYLPSNVGGYSVESIITGTLSEENVRKVKIRASAMPNDMIQGYINLVKELGLRPEALDLNSNAIAKLFGSRVGELTEAPESRGTTAYVDLGYGTINVNIISKGTLEMSRMVALNPKDFDDAVYQYLPIQPDEIESAKKTRIDIDEILALQDEEAVKIEPIKRVINQWAAEIQRVIQYYLSRNPGAEIDVVYFHGGYSNLKGIIEYMRSILNMKDIKKIESVRRIKFINVTTQQPVENYLNAAGAIIRYQGVQK